MHGGSARLQVDDSVHGDASPKHPETDGSDESIDKLRVANQALRQQLKEFSRALDASLAENTGEELSSAKSPAHGRRRNMLQALSAKEKQLKAVHKKLEIYKRANVELKKQLGSVYQPEKLAQLKNEKREKERIIRELKDENKSLLIVQRNQTKRIEEQENMKHEWPAKVSSLMADLRVAKEKLRKAKERESRVEQDSRKLHENMVKLQQKNKRLQSQLSEYEQGGGGGNNKKKKMLQEWKAEKAKLEHSIQVLEKSKQQQRTKGERLLRANMKELEKVKQEMERHKQQLNEKEKEIRLQVLQVKKLRRQLRELALGSRVGGGAGGGGDGPKDGWQREGGAGAGGSRSVHACNALRSGGSSPHHLSPMNGSRDAGDRRGGGRGRLGKAPLGGGTGGGQRGGKQGAAVVIQSAFRGAKVRKDIKQQHDAAARVQRIYRGHSARKLVKEKHQAATKMQSVFRGHRSRKAAKPLTKDQAATRIQCVVRGRAVRRQAGVIGGPGYPVKQDEEDGAVALQALYRGHKGRQRYKRVRAEKDAAARQIQAVARGYNGRVRVRRIQGERERERARQFAASSNTPLARSPSGNRILRPAGSRRNIFR